MVSKTGVNVPCPKCGAEVGEACRNAGGHYDASYVHAARRDALGLPPPPPPPPPYRTIMIDSHGVGGVDVKIAIRLPVMTESQALDLIWKHFDSTGTAKMDRYWKKLLTERYGWAIRAVLEAANGAPNEQTAAEAPRAD